MAEQQLQPVNVFVAEEGWVDQTELVDADQLTRLPNFLYISSFFKSFSQIDP